MPDNTYDNHIMTMSSQKNKKHMSSVFQQGNHSNSLDDKDSLDDSSPDIDLNDDDLVDGVIVEQKNVNRLSLAEEFAAVSGDGLMGVSLDCEDTEGSELDSEFDIGSSSATTPDWDLAPQRRKSPVRMVSPEDREINEKRDSLTRRSEETVDQLEINEKTNSLTRRRRVGGEQQARLGAMQDAFVELDDVTSLLLRSDANENYSDPNANNTTAPSCEEEDDVESDTTIPVGPTPPPPADNEGLSAESVNARNNHDAEIRCGSSASSNHEDRGVNTPVNTSSPHRTPAIAATTEIDSPNESEVVGLGDSSSTVESTTLTSSRSADLLGVPYHTPYCNLGKKTDARKEIEGLEDTMPVLDWESLEKHLARMEKDEEQHLAAKIVKEKEREEEEKESSKEVRNGEG